MPAARSIAALLVSIAFTATAVPAVARAAPAQQPPGEAAKLRPKVLVVHHDPIIESEGGRRLHEVCGWNDPRELARLYVADIAECSKGLVEYQIVATVDQDVFPVKKDGFRYTDESYLECQRGKQPWHQPDAVDYQALIREDRLVERIEKGEIDEVWYLSMPYSGFWESTMVGKGAYYCNSDPVPDVACSRLFVIMGFNYERGVGEMLEDLGHRTESILTHVFGRWEGADHPFDQLNDWERFTLHDKQAPGKAACGNVHFAPNSESDYDWGNTRPVTSTCDDWLDYPNLTGKSRTVTCADWGRGDIRAHHKWWFAHLPRAPGRKDGKLNNWWRYTIDFNSHPESRR